MCQVEKEGKGMSGRRTALAKAQRQVVGHKVGGIVAEVGGGWVMRTLPARLRN